MKALLALVVLEVLLQLGRHVGKVIVEEVVPEGALHKVGVHVVLSHLEHGCLEIDVEIGPR